MFLKELSEDHENDIAVIGFAGKLPGADSIDEFWQKIKSEKEFLKSKKPGTAKIKNDDYIYKKTSIDDADLFDLEFWSFTPSEAKAMDPQHRLFMECAWEAVESSGYDIDSFNGTIGLFAGCSNSTYLLNVILKNRNSFQDMSDLQILIGNEKDYMVSQTAYKMNIKGPCISTQTACSSSLTAVHTACDYLLSGQCDMAIVGGVTIKIPQENKYRYQPDGLVSSDGHIHTFDDQASGTVYSNGVGVAVIKRLQDAIDDKDFIYSVIRGSSINNDGSDRVGFTAPGINGQISVIEETLQVTNINPESISLVEAHGTGTVLGDAIEFQALKKIYESYTDKKGFCALGSVKTNIGHVEMAAGIFALIKTSLALKNKLLPASLNFDTPNRDLEIADSPFYINTMPMDWESDGSPRRAAVSSFGLGGSNVHMILEEVINDTIPNDVERKESDVFVLSAKKKSILTEYCKNVADAIESGKHRIEDIVYTLKVGRKLFEGRCVIPFHSEQELIQKLRDLKDEYFVHGGDKHTLMFGYTGSTLFGDDEIKQLYLNHKYIKQYMDLCVQAYNRIYGECFDLDLVLVKASKLIKAFICEYSIAKSFLGNGAEPQAVIVDGPGVLSAMATVEVISVDDCMRWLELGESGAAYFTEDSIHMFSLSDGHRLTYNDLIYLNMNEVLEDDLTNFNLQDLFGEINTTLLCLDSMGIVDLKSNEKYKVSRNMPVDLWVEQQLGVLWGLGNSIQWEQSYKNCYARRVPLPTYPFQKERYWIEESNESEYHNVPTSSMDMNEIVNNRYLLCDYLRNIWESYIGVKNVGIKDSFFGLGGQSIIAMQILSKIRKDFEVDIPLWNFLQNPTIINLSKMIEEQCKSRVAQMSSQDQMNIPQMKVDLEHRYEPFELTDIQRAYWIGKTKGLNLGNISTHIYTELDMRPIDINRLAAAFNRLIQRHEMLRGVVLEDGNQVILENVPYYEFKNYPYDKMNESNHLQFIRDKMSHQVFNSTQWPLFDIRISDLEYGHRLHISFDLLIMDAWSMEILMDELSLLYFNPETQLEEIQCSYRDYVKACLSIRNSKAYSKSKDYWCNRIDTLYGSPMLHLAKEPNSVVKPHFKRYQRILDPKTWERIKRFSAQFNVTASAVLLTSYSEVLARWSSEPQFTINLTLFNRQPIHEQINKVIGDFTSLTLLEVDASQQTTFYEKVKNIQNQLWMDMDYRYFSGLEVERELLKATNNTNKALMPVVFTSLLDLVKSYDINLEEPLITSIPYSVSQTPQVWLDHQVIERDGVLYLNFDFIEEIFFDNMINDMFDAYYQYICELADNIENWNKRIKFSSLEKKLEPLLAKHKKTRPYEIKTLNYMVSEQCIKTPDHDAIITNTLHITYQQLERSANIVASYLVDQGVKTGELVAIIMEKGWEQLVSVLGILKAGAAYLPIDVTLPKHRIEEMLTMTESRFILITDEKCAFGTGQMSWNYFKVTEHLLYQEYVGSPYHFDDIHGDAYVIFTSGSTGKPKGVRISHENVANTILDMNERLMIIGTDRVLALSSLSFDLSVYDIFGILSAGGTVVVPSSRSVRNPQAILDYMLEHGITIWNTVPAIMELLVNYLKTKGEVRIPSLRAVLLSGDYIPVQLPDEIRGYADNAQIFSLGGATEGSIWSILYPIKEVNQSWKTIPYGLSLTNQSMVVLNKKQELCPVHVKGELYITGTGVAQGYWKNEEETRKRFVWIEELGERAYHTGDLGYYLPDGNISFIGREDNQVKLNGFRIELGEIESTLMKHPNVKQAVAIFHKQQNKIYAYVVLRDNKADGVYDNNIITDHVKRLEFKLTENNLRNDGFEGTIPLVRSHSEQYYRRRSYRHLKKSKLSLQQFSNLISCLAQDNSRTQLGYPKYMYASSGGLYPVQTYVAVKAERIENVKEGLYYYNPQRHDLNRITSYNPIESVMFAEENQLIYEEAGFVIFLIGYAPRIVPMYGEKAGLQFMSIEAGLMSQLLEMTAAEELIGLCQIGSFRYDLLNSYLNTVDECVGLHCLMGGEIEEEQMTKKGFVDEQMEFQNKLRQRVGESEKSEASEMDFHRFLKNYLPKYMMPANIMILNQLPLTSNGKVDRNGLLQFSSVDKQCESRSEYKAPSDEVEVAIAEIWSDLFGGKKVGVCDNFIECGGDSFLLIKAYNRINKKYPDQIALMDLFQYPTIQMIAEKISNNTINGNDDENQMKKEESRLENRMRRFEQMRSRKRSEEKDGR